MLTIVTGSLSLRCKSKFVNESFRLLFWSDQMNNLKELTQINYSFMNWTSLLLSWTFQGELVSNTKLSYNFRGLLIPHKSHEPFLWYFYGAFVCFLKLKSLFVTGWKRVTIYIQSTFSFSVPQKKQGGLKRWVSKRWQNFHFDIKYLFKEKQTLYSLFYSI